jgi:hypothetical protein
MTALNWENMKLKSKESSYAYDELPPTGSWRDQTRFIQANEHKNRKANSSRTSINSQFCNAEANKRLHGISLVVNYLGSSHFQSRPNVEKNLIIDELRVSLKKLMNMSLQHSFYEQKVIQIAKKRCNI